ncbi:GntR family transcriptional regulator [Dactylosporangium sp. NPDC051541]|uniref:GntR family transcriptional regulator n=1 Tax=Dactylosporangium sp. NPDC051541 TaxID=3363977 RepID=UPI0037BB2E63
MTAITGQPAYQQIADDLRRKIVDGTYPVGEPIPSTTTLMAHYNGSITVVRAAIRDLQNEGVLIGQPGKGVYVQEKPKPRADVASPDVVAQLANLNETVQQLREQLAATVTTEVQELRRQVGVLQGQIMDLYGRMGLPYPHEDAGRSAGAKPRKSRGSATRSA